MISRLLACWLLFGLCNVSAGDSRTPDDIKVMAYLQALKPEQLNRTVSGIRLSDGTMELKGATYAGFRLTAKKQSIYLFKSEGAYLAYVWVAAGGKPLAIPPDKSGSPGENAGTLTGDIFTFTAVTSRDGLVILYGANPAWLSKQ